MLKALETRDCEYRMPICLQLDVNFMTVCALLHFMIT